jgi:hypothetical protein
MIREIVERLRSGQSFDPSKFKVGDHIIIHFSSPSGHLKEDIPGVVEKVHDNGLTILKQSRRGPVSTFHSDSGDPISKDKNFKEAK